MWRRVISKNANDYCKDARTPQDLFDRPNARQSDSHARPIGVVLTRTNIVRRLRCLTERRCSRRDSSSR